MGLGFAATRDLVSWLRKAPQPPATRSAISARLRRTTGPRSALAARNRGVPARFPLAGFQPRPFRRPRVRRRHPVHPGRAADFHQLPLRRARPFLAPARGPRRPRLRLPLHLRDDHRPGHRQARRHPRPMHRDQYLPEGHAHRYQRRILAGRRRAGRHRRYRPRRAAARQCPRLHDHRGSPRARHDPAGLPLSGQFAQLHASGAQPAGAHGRLDDAGDRTASQPLAECRPGRTGAGRKPQGTRSAWRGAGLGESAQPAAHRRRQGRLAGPCAEHRRGRQRPRWHPPAAGRRTLGHVARLEPAQGRLRRR